MERYLMEAPMLDFSNPAIQALIDRHGWRSLCEFERIKTIYNYYPE